jgi:hypothetical protein
MNAAASARPRGGMKLGAEPRKLAILGLVVAVGAAVFFYNSGGESGGGSTASSAVRPSNPDTPAVARAKQAITRRRGKSSSERNTLRMQEVTLEAQRGTIDPTLRLDLLERLKQVQSSESSRSLFELGAAAPPPGSASEKPVTIVPGSLPETPAAPVNTGPPPPPPIPLGYYGFTAPATSAGPRRGFFLDNENILIAGEGEIVKEHYRIVSLQAKAAVVEDTVTKNQQTSPMTPEVQQSDL